MPIKRAIHYAEGDKERSEDLMRSYSLGTTAAIGAILGAMKLGPKSDADENFREGMRIITALHQSKVRSF